MNGPVAAHLADGRLHLQHGPIDLIISTVGDPVAVAEAEAAMRRRFHTVLDELVGELVALRRPVTDRPSVAGVISGRMVARTAALCDGEFATAMICVAGAVADAIADAAWWAAELDRVIVNNGGDIAIRQRSGGEVVVGVVERVGDPLLVGRLHIAADSGIGGVATSGFGGRSQTLGIADAVTVLAADAASADVVATLVANAVDVPGHPAIVRRAAGQVRDDTDLGDRPVVTGVGPLTAADIEQALDAGQRRAVAAMEHPGVIAVVLGLRGRRRILGADGAGYGLETSAERTTVGSGAVPVAASATVCNVYPSSR